ncbi:MAG: SurA N-terminal domain-containing protein [Pseudomonadales bacterium]|nr:SurA N-terminal domain-containing protein [Pseudomonadales bacterium]NRA14292.1 SurA N-terminal domain-containing protein [Oceanospirillaceae bacterium]
MLQGIRDNSKGVVAKVIVGFIVVTFALFGIDSLVGLTQGSNAPATVNGEEISERDLYQATQRQRQQILASMGNNADPSALDNNLIRGMVLDSLIQQKALLVKAADSDMSISDEMIDKIILSDLRFQDGGSFSTAQFDAIIRSQGFTRLTYREFISDQELLKQQHAALAQSSYVLPASVKYFLGLERQTRDIRYFSMPIDKVRQLTAVSEAEVKAEFEARKGSLNTTEQVSLEYVILERDKLAATINISEEDINTQYEQVVASFQAQEQRQAAHILIEVNDDLSDDAALEKITAIKSRLDAGEDFATVAAAESNDFGSVDNGGELGIINRGTFEPAFEDALYALEMGQVSDPVQTESGYHLIKALSIEGNEAPSLADSRENIIEQLKIIEAEQLFLEQLDNLKDLAFVGGDLVDLAAELDLEIISLDRFSRAGGNDALTQNTKLVREAFSDELITEGLNSAPIEIDQANAVVIRVKEHFPVRAQTFAEVVERIREQLLTKKASELLQQRAKEAVSQIAINGDTTVVAADFEVKTHLLSNRLNAEIPAAILNKAFTLAHPAAGKSSVDTVILADSSLAVVIVDKVNPADFSEISEQELQTFSKLLAERLGSQAYQVFVQETRDNAEVERL